MKASFDNGNGAGSDEGREEPGNEPLFGDRRYVQQRLQAMKDPRRGPSEEERRAVQEALDGWRWI